MAGATRQSGASLCGRAKRVAPVIKPVVNEGSISRIRRKRERVVSRHRVDQLSRNSTLERSIGGRTVLMSTTLERRGWRSMHRGEARVFRL